MLKIKNRKSFKSKSRLKGSPLKKIKLDPDLTVDFEDTKIKIEDLKSNDQIKVDPDLKIDFEDNLVKIEDLENKFELEFDQDIKVKQPLVKLERVDELKTQVCS